MADEAKITLSDKELSLVTDTGYILTKLDIIQKVSLLFSGNVDVIRSVINDSGIRLRDEVSQSAPRIFKGENYLQLPYVIMDYPRCYNGKNIFALRTMFWWGNFFSITLHVSGLYKADLIHALNRNKESLSEAFYLGVNEDQWQHHFEPGNYLPFHRLNAEQQSDCFSNNEFLKLALKFEIEKWNEMPGLLKEGYQKITALLV